MIDRIVIGDITKQRQRHIIIGMNTDLVDVSEIGFPYAGKLKMSLNHPLILGSVLEFDFGRNSEQKLYMVICHKIGKGGWIGADRYLRFGLDSISMNKDGRFSIVNVGTGPVGIQDGAEYPLLLKAMVDSDLSLDLYVREGEPKSLTNTEPL